VGGGNACSSDHFHLVYPAHPLKSETEQDEGISSEEGPTDAKKMKKMKKMKKEKMKKNQNKKQVLFLFSHYFFLPNVLLHVHLGGCVQPHFLAVCPFLSHCYCGRLVVLLVSP